MAGRGWRYCVSAWSASVTGNWLGAGAALVFAACSADNGVAAATLDVAAAPAGAEDASTASAGAVLTAGNASVMAGNFASGGVAVLAEAVVAALVLAGVEVGTGAAEVSGAGWGKATGAASGCLGTSTDRVTNAGGLSVASVRTR